MPFPRRRGQGVDACVLRLWKIIFLDGTPARCDEQLQRPTPLWSPSPTEETGSSPSDQSFFSHELTTLDVRRENRRPFRAGITLAFWNSPDVPER